ncbi:DNA cytosine methyltransferase [Lysinibacillus sphaericus]|uniref:DNA cytosine methyltransferase n=1 Tax=Lysinibacillus sphaericus TaxID=1421 RepID=UPI0019100F8C|nr:DNA cytosine methyltransferase [Lysinibacillus sphaericus]QPA56289.1 DNA cytosine methyltransferase [Lysinibacillus sphaericus]
MKFLDLFAGVGGFRFGMEAAGHECVGFVEIDKYARKSYEAIHNTEGEWTAHDITSVTDDDIRGLRDRGQIDIICGGFPCQAFSVAGKRKGFDDTRGTLFFEIARFANIIRPQYLFLENVKGLLNHDGGITFEVILRTLDELGYDAEWQVLNSKDFGVPQNRERVFIIGHFRGRSTRKVFPVRGATTKVDTGRTIKLVGNINPSGNGMNGQVFGSDGLSPTLTTNKGEGIKIIQPVLTPDRAEKRQNGRRFKNDGEPMFTLTSQDRHGVIVWDMYNKNKRMDGNVGTLTTKGNTSSTNGGTFGIDDGFHIRKLTPRECWRLQGFPDWAFDRAAAVNSDSQLYKQAGNSVTANVIEAIAKKLV